MATPLGWLIMATPKHLSATKRLVFSTRPVGAHFFVPVDVAGRVDDAAEFATRTMRLRLRLRWQAGTADRLTAWERSR
jgi:hypothetical protein